MVFPPPLFLFIFNKFSSQIPGGGDEINEVSGRENPCFPPFFFYRCFFFIRSFLAGTCVSSAAVRVLSLSFYIGVRSYVKVGLRERLFDGPRLEFVFCFISFS